MRVTTVIPAFNAEPFIATSIQSVLNQTRPSDEIIVVDDCSTDETCNIVSRYPVRLLKTEKNSGHAAARNVAIESAEGDVIAWLDADDYFEPNHLDRVCGLLEEFPEASVAFSAVQLFGERSSVWRDFPCSKCPSNVFQECLFRTIVPAMSAVTRVAPLRQVGGFNSGIRVAPDFDLWLRMSRSCKFVSTEEVTSNYRWHPGQISSSPNRQLRSVYLARWDTLQQIKQGPKQPFDLDPEDIERKLLEYWENDLLYSWHRRDLARLRVLLSLQRFIPRESNLAHRMKWRSIIPESALKLWDNLLPNKQSLD